ncbi:hypothetical protein A0H76_3076 [Hepatospora eriocheir]|uniref:Uncharacterized protein n=1 Tax=Hepatospora eriocheir TaxID=1081669 RepID=A0A1X0Q5J5_9MICR|nr:hypothetical protein A0H76_3076 [Hepatospora eriocheir]
MIYITLIVIKLKIVFTLANLLPPSIKASTKNLIFIFCV